MALYDTYLDEDLFALLQSGDRKAFDELYNRYWDKLFVVACRRLGNPAEAEEVVQDVMLRLWSRRGEIALKSSLGAYLAVAVKYEVINWLARHRRRQAYQNALEGPEADHSTEQLVDFFALQERLSRLVKALPEKRRIVFQLSRDQGLSQKEIAERLRISENTVEAHIRKALQSLRRGLRHFLTLYF
jgi:RNA polymerase sigma-70 factor (ECF subfamily)